MHYYFVFLVVGIIKDNRKMLEKSRWGRSGVLVGKGYKLPVLRGASSGDLRCSLGGAGCDHLVMTTVNTVYVYHTIMLYNLNIFSPCQFDTCKFKKEKLSKTLVLAKSLRLGYSPPKLLFFLLEAMLLPQEFFTFPVPPTLFQKAHQLSPRFHVVFLREL